MSVRFVVDTSVVMSWCFEDEGNGYAETVLESLESTEAFAPAIWPLEVGNVLLVAERKKRLGQAAGFVNANLTTKDSRILITPVILPRSFF